MRFRAFTARELIICDTGEAIVHRRCRERHKPACDESSILT